MSNQMRQMTAMAPDYSIRWWTEKNLTPPDIDPSYLPIEKRIHVALRHMVSLKLADATVFLHDSIKKLPILMRDQVQRI